MSNGIVMSLAYRFFVLGVLFALTGMGLGTYMGITQDFLFTPVHAHVNLVGWVTHFLFGLYYRSELENSKGLLPEAHFLCALLGGVLLPVGIAGAVTDNHLVDLFVIPGTLLTLLSMLIFLAVVIRGWLSRKRFPKPQPV
jgi:FtsH-binding integral membrane protein